MFIQKKIVSAFFFNFIKSTLLFSLLIYVKTSSAAKKAIVNGSKPPSCVIALQTLHGANETAYVNAFHQYYFARALASENGEFRDMVHRITHKYGELVKDENLVIALLFHEIFVANADKPTRGKSTIAPFEETLLSRMELLFRAVEKVRKEQGSKAAELALFKISNVVFKDATADMYFMSDNASVEKEVADIVNIKSSRQAKQESKPRVVIHELTLVDLSEWILYVESLNQYYSDKMFDFHLKFTQGIHEPAMTTSYQTLLDTTISDALNQPYSLEKVIKTIAISNDKETVEIALLLASNYLVGIVNIVWDSNKRGLTLNSTLAKKLSKLVKLTDSTLQSKAAALKEKYGREGKLDELYSDTFIPWVKNRLDQLKE